MEVMALQSLAMLGKDAEFFSDVGNFDPKGILSSADTCQSVTN